MQAATERGRVPTGLRARVPTSIVVPLDGTDSARSVLPLAYLLAGTFQAPIHRVHVADRRERVHEHARRAHDEALSLLYGLTARVSEDPAPAAGPDQLTVASDEVAVIADAAFAEPSHGRDEHPADPGNPAIFDALPELSDGAEPDVEVVLPGEDPAALLADYVRSMADAVLCMASRARGGLHRRLVGNVTEQVVRASTCPVVAIGPNADLGAIGRPPATLLLAVGSGFPAHTLDVVAGWARAFDAEVVAAHVDPRSRTADRDTHGQDEVVALTNRLQGLGVEARGRVVAGPRVADALLTVAASLPQPLLLVAPVGERDDARVPTDVTHQLLHTGRWPVLASAGCP